MRFNYFILDEDASKSHSMNDRNEYAVADLPWYFGSEIDRLLTTYDDSKFESFRITPREMESMARRSLQLNSQFRKESLNLWQGRRSVCLESHGRTCRPVHSHLCKIGSHRFCDSGRFSLALLGTWNLCPFYVGTEFPYVCTLPVRAL